MWSWVQYSTVLRLAPRAWRLPGQHIVADSVHLKSYKWVFVLLVPLHLRQWRFCVSEGRRRGGMKRALDSTLLCKNSERRQIWMVRFYTSIRHPLV